MITLSALTPFLVILSTYLVSAPDIVALPVALLAAVAATVVIAAPVIVDALARLVLPAPAGPRHVDRARPLDVPLPSSPGTPGTPRTRAPAVTLGIAA